MYGGLTRRPILRKPWILVYSKGKHLGLNWLIGVEFLVGIISTDIGPLIRRLIPKVQNYGKSISYRLHCNQIIHIFKMVSFFSVIKKQYLVLDPN
ncbi:hypothetical protein XENTR_v10003044 [Xenopus tropicalis]|nr:hypothetical protein XENTR_v10003044 [Xenopus tropicalis]